MVWYGGGQGGQMTSKFIHEEISIMDYHGLLWTIMDYHGLSLIIMDSHGLSWTIKDYHGLSWTIMECHGLSWIIMDYHACVGWVAVNAVVFPSNIFYQIIE